MDFNRNNQTQKTEPEAAQPVSKAKGTKRNVSLLVFILFTLFLLAAGGGAYYWRDLEAKDQAKNHKSEIMALQLRISQLESEAAAEDTTPATVAETKAPTAEALANIEDAIKSGNTAALEGYMASKIKVILAASEGIGDRTPTQAISDLKYLDSATDPWDFSLPAATLTKWGTGDYKQYFPESAFVGMSADDMVVSFTFDSQAKISGIFMAMDGDSL